MDLTSEQRKKIISMAESLGECKTTERVSTAKKDTSKNDYRRGIEKNPAQVLIPFSSLRGRSLYITGAVKGYTKETIKQAVEEKGGIWKGFGKSLNMLVIADKPGPDKIAKAQEWGLFMVGIDQFLDWAGIRGKGQRMVDNEGVYKY